MRTLLFSLVFCLLTFFSARAEEIYRCSYFKGEGPILDGKVDKKPFWDSLPVSSDFLVYRENITASPKTYFKAAYNDEALFIAVFCQDPDISKKKVRFKDDEAVYNDDCLELFIFPDGMETYWQFVVNIEGFRYNGIVNDKKPLFNWSVKTYQGEDFYSAEIKIPFEIFSTVPEKAEKWRFNFCRSIYPPNRDLAGVRKTQTWGKSGFRDFSQSNLLLFPDEISETAKKAVKLSLREKITSDMERFAKYKKDCLQDKNNFTHFTLLEEDFKNIIRELTDLDALSIGEILSFLRQSNRLTETAAKMTEKNDEIKGRVLLKSFFE